MKDWSRRYFLTMSSSADLISATLALLTVTVGSGSVVSESPGGGGGCVAFVAALLFFAMRTRCIERWKDAVERGDGKINKSRLSTFHSSLSTFHRCIRISLAMSTDPPRTSSRPRQKSQRALEHEDTKRYLEQQLDSPAKIPRPRPKSKPKHRSYCVCKQDTSGPMIECDVCSDWCVALLVPLFPADSSAGSILNASISQRTMQRKSVRLLVHT